jgi:predicted flap endonuclease-1-like 5' DNA nuclease
MARVQAPSVSLPDPARPPLTPAQAAEPTPAAEAGGTARPSRLADAIREHHAGSPAAPRPGGDIAGLQTVRSEALRGPLPPAGAGRPAGHHDLKRIRGIGVLIEKKLNSMGITRYEQVAEWQVADIERISHVLDFKGRIERESWVEQARILAAGGQTEFSRRADRGEGGNQG